MKIDRLIGIITLLLQNDKMTAPELAEKFNVSRRTINRDINDICMAGIPIVTTQGVNGGISIMDGYKTVSYTHLRTHETVLALVCRLMIAKNTIPQHITATAIQ